ncbi:hypothetical protein K445DRAFT_320803 [Daldinia sp. EC12]|nr:hypothetical protein K445DRAFT_320803 [Daldinia sp. EC12]
MCIFPGVGFLIRFVCRHRTQPTRDNTAGYPLELIPRSDELASLESGVFYVTRNIRVDTLIVRSPNIPNLGYTTAHSNGSDLTPIRI